MQVPHVDAKVIGEIKRQAKAASKAKNGRTYNQNLDAVSKSLGFNSWFHVMTLQKERQIRNQAIITRNAIEAGLPAPSLPGLLALQLPVETGKYPPVSYTSLRDPYKFLNFELDGMFFEAFMNPGNGPWVTRKYGPRLRHSESGPLGFRALIVCSVDVAGGGHEAWLCSYNAGQRRVDLSDLSIAGIQRFAEIFGVKVYGIKQDPLPPPATLDGVVAACAWAKAHPREADECLQGVVLGIFQAATEAAREGHGKPASGLGLRPVPADEDRDRRKAPEFEFTFSRAALDADKDLDDLVDTLDSRDADVDPTVDQAIADLAEALVTQAPDFLDGWASAAWRNFRLGNTDKAMLLASQGVDIVRAVLPDAARGTLDKHALGNRSYYRLMWAYETLLRATRRSAEAAKVAKVVRRRSGELCRQQVA